MRNQQPASRYEHGASYATTTFAGLAQRTVYKVCQLLRPSVPTVVVASLFLAGCAAVGPDYKRPDVEVPPSYRGQRDLAKQYSFAELPWWEVFKDKQLGDLTREALTASYDIRIAITRVDQAKAISEQARALFLPHIGYQGGIGSGQNAFVGNAFPNGRTGDSSLVALNVAWELDLWGRIRRSNEKALARLLGREEAKRGVLLLLVSNVAQAYFELLELDLQRDIAKRATISFGETRKLFQQRFDQGLASSLELARAEASLASTAARVPDLERLIAVKENEINALLGHNPGPIARRSTLLQQGAPPELPVGLPSDLLERRPDIRRAEQTLIASNAQIGVAQAERFPRIGLTALFGRTSPELSAFTSGAANLWSVAATLAGPIFEGGRLEGQYRQATAERETAELRYQQTVLTAFQEVSNALIARQKLKEVRAQQARVVGELEAAVTLSTQRYVAGEAAYYEVLEAQQQLFPAELSLAQTTLSRLLVTVQLYKALGGGWNLKDEEWTPQQRDNLSHSS
jgi:multidrug efflux system outer membrane protein